MHLRRIHIRNVRSIADLVWELPAGVFGAGWHVILGDNGAGKSSMLRSIALALIGPNEAVALRQPWSEWVRANEQTAEVELDIGLPDDARVPDAQGGATVGVRLQRQSNELERTPATTQSRTLRNIWSAQPSGGWFAASYGPFRRFTGGDAELDKLYVSQPRLIRHLSVFGESIALTEALSWLQGLKFKQLEKSPEGNLLEPLIAFINQPGFLPHGVKLREVTSKGVEFTDASGFTIAVQDLSDGYRSILSMTFELIRQLALTYAEHVFSADRTVVVPSGIVLVDEIDAHLHPSWQRTVGVWFRQHFPNVQFIVSTHSPLICQAAEVGTVYRLPSPGHDGADDAGGMVTGVALNRLLYGNVLDAYSTGAFGDGVTRSDSGQAKLEQLAELNTRELMSNLSDDEKRTQTQLREILPTEASVAASHDPAA